MLETGLKFKDSNYYKNFEYNYKALSNILSLTVSNYYLANHFEEINTLIVNFIHSFEDFLNRIIRVDKIDSIYKDVYNYSDDEYNYFNAFRYLSNQLKHDYTLELITKPIANKSSDYFYPYFYGEKPVIKWKNFINKETNKNEYRKQYDKYLNGKEIEETIHKLFELINKL